jgi:hypothetical protein
MEPRYVVLAVVALCLLNACASERKTVIADEPASRNAEAERIDSSPPRMPKVPSLESRLSSEWLANATRIESGNRIVYFRGTAERASPADQPWLGTVKGNILLLSPSQSIVVPSGTLTLIEDEQLKWTGVSRSTLHTEPPPFRHLLPGNR